MQLVPSTPTTTMSNKQRLSPSSSSPLPANHASKLPRFLQKQNRDRSKSMVDPAASASSSLGSSSSSSSNPISDPVKVNRKSPKKSTVAKDRDDKRRQSHDADSPDPENDADNPDEPPVIVEPVNIPRQRTRSERPLSDNYPSVAYHPSSSTTRLAEIPTRLSGWLSHTFSSSSTDLSLPNLLSQQHLASSTSPKGKGSALLTAARHGKGHLDKAMRYLLDSDATPDRCTDPIWLLGVEHPGYTPPPPPTASPQRLGASMGRRDSVGSRRSPSSLSSSTSSSPITPSPGILDQSLSQSQPSSPSYNAKDPSRHWPAVFYADFTSRIWVTYRSQFDCPIRDTTLTALESELVENPGTPSSPQPKKWNWPLGGEKGWSTDVGWGCMLRTGQTLLANSILHLYLGRDWRRPPYPIYTADYATYVQIITWFLDNPACPFSVHRMALVGKDLGKDVGQWFGPSTAAGAIKTLVHAFPEAGLGVSVASDGVLYQSDVFAASRSAMVPRYSRSTWGDRAVLMLIGIRLGLDGVNPIYYDTIKAFYTLPQSVGIAGGRPSSSYYFLGAQADSLFYFDPHHARPAVPFRPPHRGDTPPPPPVSQDRWERQTSSETPDRERHYRIPHHVRSPTSPSSLRSSGSNSGSSAFSQRSPPTPSPLQQQISTSSSSQSSSSQSHTRWQSSSALPDESEMDSRELAGGSDLDPLQRHFVTAYSAAELNTFHTERVRKMPLSGLDPSMLIGFLCKDENDWIDFRRRIAELSKTHKAVFSIQEEPPSWPNDSDVGLESFSEPDIDMPEDDDEFSDGRSPSASPDTSVQTGGGKSEFDTEDELIDPITPGPATAKASFDTRETKDANEIKDSSEVKDNEYVGAGTSIRREDPIDFDEDEDEEWMDPQTDTPPLSPEDPMRPATPPPHEQQRIRAPQIAESLSNSSTVSTGTTASKRQRKKSKKSSAPPVRPPSPSPQYPFPATQPGEGEGEEAQEDSGKSPNGKRMPQMRTAKARDGGRTQSGGVRGVPADDLDDF
ncbi:peptidase family C54-domain-containing protein [Amylocystis lapponica]|nr:peptidase family C54-domain-containing protein [Amylocystis lapponica]